MKAPNPFRPGESLISFPHQQVSRCVFLWENFWKVFGSDNLTCAEEPLGLTYALRGER